jgi:hypothetical protein
VRREGRIVRGRPCKVHSGCRHANAEPLRRGERFCLHHDPNRVLEGQCEGMTRLGSRCNVLRAERQMSSRCEPLRRCKHFCAHYDLSLQTGVRCAGVRKKSRGQCNRMCESAMLHKDAAPLRRGSPFCHHHRVRCAGLAGLRCCATSSSEHAHAQPLRDGAHYYGHHFEPCEPMSMHDCSQSIHV